MTTTRRRPAARRWGLLAVGLALAGTTVATVPAHAESEVAGGGFSATIRYTEGGVAHIRANNFAGVGYGYGYGAAKDNLCVLADMYLTLSAQRSKVLGPDGPANDALGSAGNNLASDLHFQRLIDSGEVERLLAQPAPLGPKPEVRELIRGYVAGYNRQVRESGGRQCPGGVPVRQIGEIDVYRHLSALATTLGQGIAVDGLTAARPPAPSRAETTATAPAEAAELLRSTLDKPDMGSNAIAVGKDGTADGGGVLLGNPHYPWHGGRRFWQVQLTVPGRMDVSGGTLLGLPLVQIGFNRDVAWSHTVASARPFGLHELKLVPGDPTSYLVDGKPEKMTSRQVSVEVRKPDGSIGRVERTLYGTRYGPVLTGIARVSLPWTTTTAYALQDPNAQNIRLLNTWYELGRTRDTDDVLRALTSTQGVPWVNTIATDRAGHALYADVQVVPHVTDELARRCSTPLGQELFRTARVPVLDGSRGDCAWGRDPDALQPGTFGPKRLPVLQRSDYVLNSNDSAWLTNPHQLLTDYPQIVGFKETEAGPRTRMAVTAVEDRLAGRDGLPGRKFSRQSMQDVLFSDRSMTAELAAADTARMCRAFPGGKAPTSKGTVDVGRSCEALEKWDRRYTVDSRGALLFDRFWQRVESVTPSPWRVPFDRSQPVTTPNTLDIANPAVRRAFGDAVEELGAIAPDARLGENQYVVRNGERIPVHGGDDKLGVLNMIVGAPWKAGQGYTEVVHGSSHIQAVSFGRGACPDAATLLTYSQSSDPSSPHHVDQTRLFSQGKWQRARFCEQDIQSSPELRVVHIREH
ncbi:acyl-homoserine-lactone acylase [Streptoalloteichus tenebrarius]|uniref:Acyl-homoserine-lactone acylase n=1 Tax=Streptoalloteichus tenebrarius (strain ATCC 17920 / DSM 40477 / JCM 4838 / CBS 697.72 / NBRC 16177 / NCIMB 11028 / NRRL B-12390 / A12253. 1 / ISP 5477) TaxID=1933 RepID=A0ABT1I1U2_STRSD|nr:penicillin acylase family protein [Streptoalloteichus tenebrarius]MCP2261752.1 acyl-homoserine-lactone acylase [Streptoalloteichus tenebrarius]